MKKNYFFLLLTIVLTQAFSQSKNCEDAHQDLVYAYSHIKSSYNSNNHTHLKHYAQRSIEAFERAKSALSNCDCDDAYSLAYDAHDQLFKVTESPTFEDGRFHVKHAREDAKEAIIALENCTKSSATDDTLADLEAEKLRLKQQQIELKLKEEKIKQQLAEQAEKETQLKKQKLITKNETVIVASIDTYNNSLKACECKGSVKIPNLKSTNLLLTQNISSIKQYYIGVSQKLVLEYSTWLNNCK